MEALERILLYDYYGDLLTQRQQMCFDLHYNQDLSLGEIAQELNISRQGVHDNLSRAEALLKNMEEKTGCVNRDMQMRKAMHSMREMAEELRTHSDDRVRQLAEEMITCAQGFEE